MLSGSHHLQRPFAIDFTYSQKIPNVVIVAMYIKFMTPLKTFQTKSNQSQTTVTFDSVLTL